MTGLDPTNAVNDLCVRGMAAEGRGAPVEAKGLYEQAWAIHTSDLEAAVAAHYVARHQPNAEMTSAWNMIALASALQCDGELVAGLLPSLYLNAGKSREDAGEPIPARIFYLLARRAGDTLGDDPYAQMVRRGIDGALDRTRAAMDEIGQPM